MEAVNVRSLKKTYGEIEALKNLSFSVEKGTMYGLIGPDGAGKSTFMRIAACILFQSGGTVEISGFDTLRQSKEIKKIIGYMPQRFSLYPDLSVMENLVFFAELFGVRKRERESRIEQLLSFSRLGPFVKRRAENLSGGMKQKLALSCTLIHTPEVLFLDEPTTGVDPISRREFWNILGEIKKGGTTIVVSTPYMDEAEKCDRVGFIDFGKLIREGAPGDFPGQFIRQILAVRGQDIVKRARRLNFPEVVLNKKTFGDRLHLTVDDAETAALIIKDFLARNGIENITVERTPPSMEDIFVEDMTHAG
jgi:ABC-2 type transport system ATP-binding protein